MKLHLKVWRQESPQSQGKLEIYDLDDVSPDSSFLEMLDLLNEQLFEEDKEPVAFDHDCREGICGMCGLMINGVAHGQDREKIKQITACQLHMRHFHDGETITIEPWRAQAFPVLKDLIVDRTAFDRIIQSGGYVSVSTGSAPDANAIPIPKPAPIPLWMPRHASAVAPAWPPARTLRQCSLHPPKCRNLAPYRRGKPNGSSVW
jgi:succinate dehydrogenase / fumarate reductase iron-sulfur subunit